MDFYDKYISMIKLMESSPLEDNYVEFDTIITEMVTKMKSKTSSTERLLALIISKLKSNGEEINGSKAIYITQKIFVLLGDERASFEEKQYPKYFKTNSIKPRVREYDAIHAKISDVKEVLNTFDNETLTRILQGIE